jgi:hypothetical protein
MISAFLERLWEKRRWRITAKCCGILLFAAWVYCGMPMICHSSSSHAAEGPEKAPPANAPLLLTQTCLDADEDFKGAFNLCMRLYAPKSDALTGKWNPPPVVKVEGPSEAMPQ